MLPEIQPGALLYIESGKFQEQALKPGELIAFYRGDGIVCHRYYGTVKIGRKYYGIEKGDYNRIAGLFRMSDYLGKVTMIDKESANFFFREVQKPRKIALFWGLLQERFHWLFQKKP